MLFDRKTLLKFFSSKSSSPPIPEMDERKRALFLGQLPQSSLIPRISWKARDRTAASLSRGDLTRKWGFDYLSDLKFERADLLDWSYKSAQKKLRKAHLSKENEWVKSLFGASFSERLSPPIEIRYIDAIVGYGIFASEAISELTYIGEYTGVVRKKRRSDLGNPYIFRYTVGPSQTHLIVDAKEEGNFVRMINHSEWPNCTSRWYIADGVSHIILFSNKRIAKGEQLTYNYGEDYWRKRMYPIEL